jgi:serine phosphatase RsbU (regulator of sigma subunit)
MLTAPLSQARFGLPLELQLVVAAALLLLLFAVELADRVTMKRDLEIAREIQTWLIPDKPPQVSGVDMAFLTQPANTVGGDYHDVLTRSNESADGNTLLVIVADVAGKSVPAALLMATLQASFRTLADASTPMPRLMEILNRSTVARGGEGRRFVTAFLAELDLSSHTLSYTCAGHNAPILRRSSGNVERLAGGGLPLGVDSEEVFSINTTRLEDGDLLMIFTDGVTDAASETGDLLGDERLLSWVRSLEGATSADLLGTLMSRLGSFVGAAVQRDDITMFLLQRA